MASWIPIGLVLLLANIHWNMGFVISPNTEENMLWNQIKYPEALPDFVLDDHDMETDPAAFLRLLAEMDSNKIRPIENIKRGIDFGLGRGFSGSQAARHSLGMAAASFTGGPGKRKRSDE